MNHTEISFSEEDYYIMSQILKQLERIADSMEAIQNASN